MSSSIRDIWERNLLSNNVLKNKLKLGSIERIKSKQKNVSCDFGMPPNTPHGDLYEHEPTDIWSWSLFPYSPSLLVLHIALFIYIDLCTYMDDYTLRLYVCSCASHFWTNTNVKSRLSKHLSYIYIYIYIVWCPTICLTHVKNDLMDQFQIKNSSIYVC